MDLAALSRDNYLPCQCDCRGAVIVVTDHVQYAVSTDCLEHLFGLCQSVCERLFAKYNLLRLGRGYGNRQVRVAGSADIDDVNVRSRDNLFPRCRMLLPAQRFRSLLYGSFRTAANDLHYGFEGRVEKPVNLAPGVAVSPTHELIPDHRNVQFLFHAGQSRIFAVALSSTGL